MTVEGQELETVDDELELESGTPPEVDEGTPPVDDEGEPTEDPNWKSLQEKYPGKSDEEIRALVSASYWDQTRALSAGAKKEREQELEIARLQGRVEGSGPPPDAEPPTPPPEIQEVDEYIAGLEQQDQEIAQSQTETLKALSDAKDGVSEVKGRIAAAKEAGDEEKAERLGTDLRFAERNVTDTRRDLDRTVRDRKNLTRERGQALKERGWRIKLIQEAQARQESEQQELEEALEGIPTIVDGHITSHMEAKETGIPADPALREHLRDHLRDKVTIDLWKAGGEVPFNKIDVPGLVRQHTAKYMKANGLAKRAAFGSQSERKTRVAGGEPPKATPTSPDGRKPAKTVVSGTGALSEGMLRARRVLGKSGW